MRYTRSSWLGRALATGLALATLWPAALAAETSDDESIYVVQRRAYSKRGKLELTPLFASTVNNKFVGFIGPGASIAYHLRENFALELAGIYALSYYSGLVYEVYDYEQLIPENVDLKQLQWFASLGVQWSPIYGKFNVLGVLGDFDVYLGAGLGAAATLEPCTTVTAGCTTLQNLGFGLQKPLIGSDYLKLAGTFAVGMRIFFADWLGVKVELRDVSFGDKVDAPGETSSDIRNNLAVMLGASFLL